MVKVNMIYVRGRGTNHTFDVKFEDGEGSHSLVESGFPDLHQHGDGYVLREYDEGEVAQGHVNFYKSTIRATTQWSNVN